MAVRPQRIAQVIKMGNGFAVVRNSATLAVSDYPRVAHEIARALNAVEELIHGDGTADSLQRVIDIANNKETKSSGTFPDARCLTMRGKFRP
jgi:hypothetical protein